MIAIVRITGKSIGAIRFCIELAVLVVGWMLGGTIGIGTLITVAFLEYCIQLVFKIFKLNITGPGISSGMEMGIHILKRAGYDSNFISDVVRILEYTDAYKCYENDIAYS